MSRRCNIVGIRIYVDAVFNHMTAGSGTGTGGSKAYYQEKLYPGVVYHRHDFHKPCPITTYQDAAVVRNCQLKGLLDLDQGLDSVRGKIVDYMNHLIELGVAGFRVDAAKHMWPRDLDYIYSKLDNLNVKFGFVSGSRPFIFQEVLDDGHEAINKNEYTRIGRVVEFQVGYELSNAFRGNNKLTYLENWGPAWGLLNSDKAVAFIDNHDTQRNSHEILTYKTPKQYKMATAFMLAHPYGTTRVMSSYEFDSMNQGPPADSNGNLISPGINHDGTCSNGYVCEHRWRQIFNMVEFRNVVHGTDVTNWWSDNNQQIAFCRGNKGFIVFTNYGDVDRTFQTCLEPGIYCDVISGVVVDGKCTGKAVSVVEGGWAYIVLGALEEDGVLAIHTKAKIMSLNV
ncbi:alpha-amylase-like isoform X3 [Tenebrio molitor]